jgi:hypothetical protein
MTTTDADDDNNALRDPALRRALDHAPDRDALPDPRTRDAIRKMAHNLAPVPAPSEASAAAMPWWRRLIGDGAKNRMPWNAAFATVLVATFVTVLWQHEPVPDARLDGEAQVAQAPAPASAPAPAPAPAPEAARSRVETEAAQQRTEPARAPAPAAVASDRAAIEPERGTSPSLQSAPAPAAGPAPEPAPAMIAKPSESALQAEAPGVARQALVARKAAPAPAAAPKPAPSFAALDRWTSLNWVASGQAVREARGDTEDLAALVNAVARSAVVPNAALAAPVEVRIELHAGAQLLAVLEIAGDQVRWAAPQGGTSFVGTPPPPALAALRAALRRS